MCARAGSTGPAGESAVAAVAASAAARRLPLQRAALSISLFTLPVFVSYCWYICYIGIVLHSKLILSLFRSSSSDANAKHRL